MTEVTSHNTLQDRFNAWFEDYRSRNSLEIRGVKPEHRLVVTYSPGRGFARTYYSLTPATLRHPGDTTMQPATFTPSSEVVVYDSIKPHPNHLTSLLQADEASGLDLFGYPRGRAELQVLGDVVTFRFTKGPTKAITLSVWGGRLQRIRWSENGYPLAVGDLLSDDRPELLEVGHVHIVDNRTGLRFDMALSDDRSLISLAVALSGQLRDQLVIPNYPSLESVIKKMELDPVIIEPVQSPPKADRIWRQTRLQDAVGLTWTPHQVGGLPKVA